MLNTIVPFIVLILVVVFIHEYGHYYFARKYGVGVTDFSIGFGKEIFGWNDKSGTRWKICWIPLGGYVKFFGDRNVFSQSDQEEVLKKYMTIPLINGLSPRSHPTQVLSDVFTIQEIKKKPISKLQICWIGDSNNVLNSLIEASVKFSFKLNIGCPKKYEPNKILLSWAKKNKSNIKIFNDSKKAAKGSDVVFTDKVISMNDKVNKIKKMKDFKNFKVTSIVMNCAKKDAIFLHCLPRGSEVSNGVFLGKQSKVFQQALNRIYVQKSILLYCFEKLR